MYLFQGSPGNGNIFRSSQRVTRSNPSFGGPPMPREAESMVYSPRLSLQIVVISDSRRLLIGAMHLVSTSEDFTCAPLP